MSTAVTTGVFTLGGVLVGGLLNGWVTYLLDAHRESEDASAAAWLVLADLARSRNAVQRGRDKGQWVGFADSLRLDTWHERKELLFRAMRPDDIHAVYDYHRYIEVITEFPDPKSIPVGLLNDAVDTGKVAAFSLNRVAAYGPNRRLVSRIRYRMRHGSKVEPLK